MLFLGTSRPITFRTIAFVVLWMTASLAFFALTTSRAEEQQSAHRWVWSAAGVIATGFAAVFLAFGLRWIRLDPEARGQTFYWLGSYFAFSAIYMLTLALDRFGLRTRTGMLPGGALPTS